MKYLKQIGTSNEKGSMLLAVMFSFVLLAIGIFMLTKYIVAARSNDLKIKRNMARSVLVKQIIENIQLTEGLVESSQFNNDQLHACIKGGPVGACPAYCCKDNDESGFIYLDPTDTEFNVNVKRQLTGPPTAPKYFDINSGDCVPTAADGSPCHYRISTKFTPHCPPDEDAGPPNVGFCDHAEHLNIKVFAEPTGIGYPFKSPEYSFNYFVKLNYQPKIKLPLVGTEYTIDLDVSPDLLIPVDGYAGHPSEYNQNFKFTKCNFTTPGFAELNPVAATAVDCPPFGAGSTLIRVKGLLAGVTELVLQISDEQPVNAVSIDYKYKITVIGTP